MFFVSKKDKAVIYVRVQADGSVYEHLCKIHEIEKIEIEDGNISYLLVGLTNNMRVRGVYFT